MRSRLPCVGGSCTGYLAAANAPRDASPVTIARRRVMRRVLKSIPNGHRPDLPAQSGSDDHDDVDDHEQQERDEREEVNRACRLIPTEQPEEPGMSRGHRG